MPLGTCQQDCNMIRIIKGRKKWGKKMFCFYVEVNIDSSLWYEKLNLKKKVELLVFSYKNDWC